MKSQARWGLFVGFNPQPEEACWRPPHCNQCGASKLLLPWIDWWGIGTIGYCPGCSRFYHVASDWEQIPGAHPREERERLVNHHVSGVELDKLSFPHAEKLWLWHQTLPSSSAALEEIDQLRRAYSGGTEEAVLLSLLFWTLIWNIEAPSAHLLDEFFEFSLRNPQYIKYKGKTVWLGHQLNLVESLEARYKNQVLGAVFSQWNKHHPSSKEFGDGLGFFIPTSNSELLKYGAEFAKSAQSCRVRFAI